MKIRGGNGEQDFPSPSIVDGRKAQVRGKRTRGYFGNLLGPRGSFLRILHFAAPVGKRIFIISVKKKFTIRIASDE